MNFNNHERRSVTAFFHGTAALKGNDTHVDRDSDEKRTKKKLQTVSVERPRASRSHFADFPDSRIRLPLSWKPHATPHASMSDKTVSRRLQDDKGRFHMPFSAL